jgi:4-amino-4-deoxy-L-arabinose transferase-like glycosyltransferase
MSPRREPWLWAILAAYLLAGVLFALRTPAWQAPDEPAHYNYVAQLVNGTLPVMEPGDYDQAYLEAIVSSRFAPGTDPGRLTYEDWQPPLYYLLQAPVYALTGGSLTAMRLLSVLLGAGVVVLVYLIVRRIWPDAVWAAAAAAAFVAFVPQHLAILGSVNNDSLAELLIAAILLALVAPAPPEQAARRQVLLGVLLGLGFLTKGTVYLMAPVIGVALLVQYWGSWRDLIRAGLRVFAPALLLGSLWWLRNVFVYGGFDVLARNAHDAVVVGQPRTAEWVARYGLVETVGRFFSTTFNSFWGQFGWMAAPLPGWAYALLAALTAAAAGGLLLAGLRGRRTGAHRLPSVVLSLTLLLTLALHIGYNLTFVQHQGRYLFPALAPIAVGFALGLGAWLRPWLERRPALGHLVPLGLSLLLLGLAAFSLLRIIPGLSPP